MSMDDDNWKENASESGEEKSISVWFVFMVQFFSVLNAAQT